MIPLLLAALLGLSALAIVLAPLFVPAPAGDADPAAAPALAERERAAKAALRDVELDYQLGNLDGDDYRALRDRYTRRALTALKGRYDRERALDAAIEERVAALRAAAPAVRGNGRGRIHNEDTEDTEGERTENVGRSVKRAEGQAERLTRREGGQRARGGGQVGRGGHGGQSRRHAKRGRGKA
jgi:hypothetical protein